MARVDELYNRVFTENDKVKNCGREQCSKLIAELKRLDDKTDFGDERSGKMNVENIVGYYRSYRKGWEKH
jgi:hypothetical protein